MQHGDALVLLAARLLWDLAVHVARSATCEEAVHKRSVPPQMPLLLEAITLLEAGRAESGYNFQFTIQLMRTYLAVGAFAPAMLMFNKLDVKHIMVRQPPLCVCVCLCATGRVFSLACGCGCGVVMSWYLLGFARDIGCVPSL